MDSTVSEKKCEIKLAFVSQSFGTELLLSIMRKRLFVKANNVWELHELYI
jgi:hypothetical protein